MLIAFRVSGQDGKAIAKNFDTTPRKKVVIGTEPVRAPVTDILGHLVRRGHTNPVVNAFTRSYLIPLETFLQQVRNYSQPFEFGSTICRTGYLIEGRRLVNDALFESMQSGRPDGRVHPWALLALMGAANDGSSRVLHPYIKSSVFSGAQFLGFDDRANALGEAALLRNERVINWLVKKYARERWWESLSEYRFVYPGEAFVRLLKALRSVLTILAAEPVLVDTGQYREKYQLQTYADAENEIGNFLSSGLGNYEAKVKILTTEYTIRTRPAPEVLTGERLAQRQERIRRQMRERGYTRPYQDVAAEIRARYARYRGLTEAPPAYSGNSASRARPSAAGAGDKATPPPPPPGSAFSPGETSNGQRGS
jgi:hypothetical protein